MAGVFCIPHEAQPLTGLIVGFAIGVQQLHPTLIQRTYG